MGKNAHNLGYLPRAELADILRWCDVGLLFYKPNRYHHYVELFEYPQAGLTVVATGIPEAEWWHRQHPRLIRTAADVQSVGAAIMEALAEQEPERQVEIERFLRENSVETRARTLLEAVRAIDAQDCLLRTTLKETGAVN